MVYVLNKNGQSLMPTNRHGKVKHLLKDGKAKVVKRCPFTIKLTYETTNYTQDLTEVELLELPSVKTVVILSICQKLL